MNQEKTSYLNEFEAKQLKEELAAVKITAVWRGYAVRHLPRGRKRSAEAISPAAKRRKYLTMDPSEGLTLSKYAGMSADEIEAAPALQQPPNEVATKLDKSSAATKLAAVWRGYAVRHITFDIEDALWRKKRPKQAKHEHEEGPKCVDMMDDFEYEEFEESEVEWLREVDDPNLIRFLQTMKTARYVWFSQKFMKLAAKEMCRESPRLSEETLRSLYLMSNWCNAEYLERREAFAEAL